MKKQWTVALLMAVLSTGCMAQNRTEAPARPTEQTESKGEVIKLTKEVFLAQVFNYEQEKDWKFLGKRPAIIDLYADWCGPCRQVAPVFKKLAKEYAGKVDFYKVNVDRERELAAFFEVKGIPLFIFIPQDSEPRTLNGAIKEDDFRKIIDQFLLKVQ